MANFLSSALTLASISMPWIKYNIGPTLSAIQAADASLALNASSAVSLVVTGGTISLLSRYGGLLTMAGVWLFVASPPEQFLFVASNVVITYSFETGVWLAWAGATISLLGSSWTLPFGLPTMEVNRKNWDNIILLRSGRDRLRITNSPATLDDSDSHGVDSSRSISPSTSSSPERNSGPNSQKLR